MRSGKGETARSQTRRQTEGERRRQNGNRRRQQENDAGQRRLRRGVAFILDVIFGVVFVDVVFSRSSRTWKIALFHHFDSLLFLFLFFGPSLARYRIRRFRCFCRFRFRYPGRNRKQRLERNSFERG